MKTMNIWKLGAVLLMGAAVSACSKGDEGLAEDTPAKEYTCIISATAEAEAESTTRVSYYDGVGVEWNVGEKIGLVKDGNTKLQSAELTSGDITTHNGDKYGHRYKANFKVSYLDEEAGDFIAYHPVRDGEHNDQDQTKYNNIYFMIPESQWQEWGGNMHQAGYGYTSGICMVGKSPVTLNGGDNDITTENNLQFKVVNTIVRFYIYDTESCYSDEKINKVTITSHNEAKKLAGEFNVDNNGNVINMNGTSATVFVNIANGVDVVDSKDDAKAGTNNGTNDQKKYGIYLATLPCGTIPANEDGTVTYTVETNKGIYTFNSKAEKSFDSGKIIDVSLNLSNANAVQIDNLYLWVGNNVTPFELSKNDGGLFKWTGEFWANHDDDMYLTFTNEANTSGYKIKANGLLAKSDSPKNGTEKALKGAGYYTSVEVNIGAMTISMERIAPRLYGETTANGWGGNGNEMNAVPNKPGVYYIFHNFPGSNAAKFKFTACEDKLKGQYYADSNDSDRNSYNKFFKKLNTVHYCTTYASDDDNTKWRVEDWHRNKKYYIELDTKDMKMRMIPQEFYIIGDNDWTISGNTRKLTLNPDNMKATGTVTLSNSGGTFKIYSSLCSDFEWGLWLFADPEGPVLSSDSSNVNLVYDPNDPKGLLDYKWKIGETGQYYIELDVSDWPTTVTLKGTKQSTTQD